MDELLTTVTESVGKLRLMAEKEAKIASDLTAKMQIAVKMDQVELAHTIEREVGHRQKTLLQLLVCVEAAEAGEDAVRRIVTPPQIQDAAKRITDALDQVRAMADEAAKSVCAYGKVRVKPGGTLPEGVLDAALRRMREAQIVNRERVVQLITQKNNLLAITARERSELKQYDKDISSADRSGQADQARRLRRARDASRKRLEVFEAACIEAVRRADDARAYIRREDDAIRIAFANVLRKRQLDSVIEMLERAAATASAAAATISTSPS